MIRKKVKSAVTDSGSGGAPRPRQGGRDEPDRRHDGRDGRDARGDRGALRRRRLRAVQGHVAEAVVALLEPIQARYAELRGDPAELSRMLALGAGKAREASAPTLAAMYDRMGFVLPA